MRDVKTRYAATKILRAGNVIVHNRNVLAAKGNTQHKIMRSALHKVTDPFGIRRIATCSCLVIGIQNKTAKYTSFARYEYTKL